MLRRRKWKKLTESVRNQVLTLEAPSRADVFLLSWPIRGGLEKLF